MNLGFTLPAGANPVFVPARFGEWCDCHAFFQNASFPSTLHIQTIVGSGSLNAA
ncbi:MAG: hypothetical protein JWN24_268 [Phycisphaerales bacterium]|nr:hypothetical protein [Phycisphaerales bacterium]